MVFKKKKGGRGLVSGKILGYHRSQTQQKEAQPRRPQSEREMTAESANGRKAYSHLVSSDGGLVLGAGHVRLRLK